MKEKERRRKRRQAKLAANQGESSYASIKFNPLDFEKVDPLDFEASSSSSSSDDEKTIIL
jgi:hypothetical protein